MKKFYLTSIILLGILHGTEEQFLSTGCPSGWVLHQSTCYKFAEEQMVYEEADAACWAFGARLLSVGSFSEHQFVSGFMMTNKLSRQTYYFTSGYYFLGRLYWEGDRTDGGPTFWLNDQPPAHEGKIYRIAYIYTETEYKWINVSASILAHYICEIPRPQAQRLDLMDRDFSYGLDKSDVKNIKIGPTFVSQPESIVVFEGVEVVDIECTATGNPYPKYKWYRGSDFVNQTEVTSAFDNRYTLTGGKFTIEDVQRTKDLDNYHCKAENDIGAVLSNKAKILFGYLGYISNVEPEPLYAEVFKGTKINCETPSHSPRVNYAWFKNRNLHIFIRLGNFNFFVSWTGALYVSEVQPTDVDKRYYCLITLVGTEDAKLGKANTLVRTNKGILMLSLGDITSDNNYGPIVYTHLFPSPTLRGYNIRMECIAYGTHPLFYSWRREDGRPFVPGTVLSSRNRILTIKNAPLEADGNYVCTCTRKTGTTVSKTITLSMETKPYFPYPIENVFADPGMTITWNCKAVARPSATYSWYKNGNLLRNTPGWIEIQKNVLKIIQVTKDRDEGMYQCAATNQHGTTFSTGQLKVLYFAPNFHRKPMSESMLAAINGNITIPCGVEGAPLPDVDWLKNGASLNIVKGDMNGRVAMNLEFGLVITAIQYSDRGYYTCKATNILGDAVNSTQLHIVDGIVFTQAPTPSTVQVNRTAFMFCHASIGHNYDLTYLWKFNGKEIDYTLSPEYVNGQRNSLDGLYITNAQFKNSGVYECVAITTLQSIQRFATLEVQGPPGAPAGVYPDVDSITTRSVRLTWSLTTEINHGGAITGFDIEAETGYHPNVWYVVASDVQEYVTVTEASNLGKRTDQRAITVHQLIPNTNYRFRVRAINAFGRGQEASKPSSFVKIEQTAPIIAPRHVSGGGGKVGTLTITWEILDESEHCGSNLIYYVYWKRQGDTKDWKLEKADNDRALKEGRYVVTVGTDNYYLQYRVKVGAYNDNGHGPNSTEQIIYSAEGMPNTAPVSQYAMTYNATSIIVYWDVVPDTREAIKGRIAGYRIHYYANIHDQDPFGSEPDPILNQILTKDVYGQTEHVQLIGLIPNMEYFARVQVFNGAGFGPKGEWRRSETSNLPLHDHPTFVTVYQQGPNSVLVKWRGVGAYPLEESLQGYILRVWKLQEDLRTATDTKVGKVNEAVIEGLQQNSVYILRVLGYSRAGDGGLSEAVYFSLAGKDGQALNIPIDPTTSQICYSDEYTRTCGSDGITGESFYITFVTILYFILAKSTPLF
ncbi:contactin-like isoform X2 [Mercenaria mercenaria]|uniref:contactin-like isoform X2 n=1 Tax=Mercenaria mercenaria TaxID=6596 RepID=UPI00234E954C|nr:contactin-like isoform X2 [Mercenaria mercenaria]